MRISNVAMVGAALLALAACDASAPAQTEVSGLRDDIKHVPAVKEVSHKEKKTKRVCARRAAGKCKEYKDVPDGFKKVVDKPGKPALYCVEVDDVNGSPKDDDVWYTVTAGTYLKAAGLDEGEKLTFMPAHGGCW